MDDGNKVTHEGLLRGYHLNTQSFSKEENENPAKILKDLYEVDTVVERNNGKFRLAIWKKASRDQFKDHIEHFILPSMRYKISV